MHSLAPPTSKALIGLLLVTLMPLVVASCTSSSQPIRMPIRSAASAPSITAIAACDAYLNSYLECHRAAGIFPAEQLSGRYQAMRQSLLEASHDPLARPLLEQRCVILRRQINDLLSKPC